MELRYCEECGDMIRLESDTPASLHEHFLCPKCKGEAPHAPSASAPEQSASATVSTDDLDLFSSQSIALKKQEAEAELARSPQGRLRLVKTTAASGVEAPSRQDPGVDGASRLPPQTARPPSDARAGGPVSGAPAAGAPRPAKKETSGRPAKSARKIIFRCLHCKSPLSIRPVEKTSKLLCPSCQQAVYVTPDGRLLKNNPSHAKRKDAAQGSGSGSRREAQSVRVARLAAPPSPSAPRPRAAPQPSPAAPEETDDLDDRERLSAFEEHVFSQDPDKTAFLTEEASPLADLEGSEVDEFPLASELVSTASRTSQPEEPEEEWPDESDLLAEDEFDEDVGSGSRRNGRADTRRQPTARIVLVGLSLFLPFVLAAWLFVKHYSALETRSNDWPRMQTTLERLGTLAQEGSTALFGELPPEGVRRLPWSRP